MFKLQSINHILFLRCAVRRKTNCIQSEQGVTVAKKNSLVKGNLGQMPTAPGAHYNQLGSKENRRNVERDKDDKIKVSLVVLCFLWASHRPPPAAGPANHRDECCPQAVGGVDQYLNGRFSCRLMHIPPCRGRSKLFHAA